MFSDSPSMCGSEAPLIVRGGSVLVVLQPLECPNLAESASAGSPADFGWGIVFEDVETELNRRMASYNRGILKALVSLNKTPGRWLLTIPFNT